MLVPRCHVILANLRKPGEKGYKIPKGFLFNFITCANYTTEIWGWTLFSIGTQTIAAFLFTAAGAYQMAIWAQGKHKRLVKVRGVQGELESYTQEVMLRQEDKASTHSIQVWVYEGHRQTCRAK